MRPLLYLVDDDPFIVRSLRRTLQDHYEVVPTDPEAALALAREPAMILCDVQMPRMDGPAFYQELLARKPGWAARLVFMTGLPDDPVVLATGRPVLAKPFTTTFREDLARVFESLGAPSP